jgi:hypothetical protein
MQSSRLDQAGPGEATWTRPTGTVAVRVREKRDGQAHERVLDYPATNPDGLLHQTLTALPVIGIQQARDFLNLLPDLLGNPKIRELLEQPPSSLARNDIKRLFSLIEAVLEPRSLAPATKEQHSRSTRHVLEQCPLSLRDGWTAASSGFQSKFARPARPPDQGKRRAFPLQVELQTLEFENLEERRSVAYRLHRDKQETLVRGWVSLLDEHRQISARLELLAAQGIDGLPRKMHMALLRGNAPKLESFRKLNEDDKLRVAMFISNRNEGQAVGDAIAGDYVPLVEIAAIQHLSALPTQRYLSEILFAHRFLPRKVSMSCLCILLSRTALNSDTVLGLRLSDMKPIPGGYELVGIKGKTDQIHERKVVSPIAETSESDVIMDEQAVRALDLLVKNAKHVAAYTNESDYPLFSVANVNQRGKLKFIPLPAGKLAREMRLAGAKEFELALSDLRPLAAHTEYLSDDGDIFSTQVLLMHKSADTTATYLRSTIIKALGQANINRYIKILTSSLLIASNRRDLAKLTKLEKYASPRLLFPYGNGEQQANSCLVDDWINSAGNIKLIIGPAELEHLAFQHRYYLSQQQLLANANPLQFVRLHLPRIAVCIAMRKVVLQSSHRVAYLKFERSGHGFN